MQNRHTETFSEIIKDKVKELQKRRVRMILTNLLYFVALLIIGLVMFFKDAGQWIYVPIAAIFLFYLFVDRPMLKGFEHDLRESILRFGVMSRLDEAEYLPKEGVPQHYITDAGFINVIADKAFLSRELIKGRSQSADIQIADVTFPIREGGLNKMFSGCLIHLEDNKADYPKLDIVAGDISGMPDGKERRLVKKIGEFIPGSLYLHREGHVMDVLLRGRFVGFQINPLGEVHESTLKSDPLPELKQVLELAEEYRA